MRILPCTRCHAPALATRDGVLHTAGIISDRKIQYLCKRCGYLQQITDIQFSLIPEATLPELRALAARGAIDIHYSSLNSDIPPTTS